MSLGGAALPGSAPVVSSLRRVPVELVVFAVALAARTAVVLRSGGFLGNYGYDASVYYAAADALIHGRMPYRDFVLLHPPGLMLAVTPFALLGRLTTDHIGYAGANLGFCIVGALNAVLVVRVVKRLGLGARSAAVGGLFYAAWFTSVSAEFLARLDQVRHASIINRGVATLVAANAHRRSYCELLVAGAPRRSKGSPRLRARRIRSAPPVAIATAFRATVTGVGTPVMAATDSKAQRPISQSRRAGGRHGSRQTAPHSGYHG